MTNVVTLPSSLNVDHVLDRAKGEYKSLFIIGWDNDGVMDARAGGDLTQTDLLWLIEKFKHKLMNGDYEPD